MSRLARPSINSYFGEKIFKSDMMCSKCRYFTYYGMEPYEQAYCEHYKKYYDDIHNDDIDNCIHRRK